MTSNLDLDAMRRFAEGLSDDLGPLFGRDVVRLIDEIRNPCPRCSHDDPDNSGLCVKCGKVLDEPGWAKRELDRMEVETKKPITSLTGYCSQVDQWEREWQHYGETTEIRNPCPRCGSDEWEYIDYGGCSECRPNEEREHEDDDA